MKRRVFFNSLSGSGLFAVNLIVAFLLSPVMVRKLGDADYGIWEILISLFGYFSVLDLGVAQGIVRFVARAAGANDREQIDRIASSALIGLGISGVAALAVMAGLSLVPQHVMDLTASQVSVVRAAMLLVGVNLMICLPGFVFTAHLFGLQRHGFVNGVDSVLAVVQGVVVYVMLTRTDGPYLVYLAWILAGVNLAKYVALALISSAQGLQIRLRHVHRKHAVELYRYGSKSVLLTIADRLQRMSVPVVVGSVLGTATVVFYALPNRLVTYANGLIGTLTLPLTPYFSFMEGEGRTAEDSRRAWLGLTRCLQFVLAAMAVVVIGLGEPFIARWIGPAYAEQGRWPIRILGASLFAEALAPAANQFLLGLGLHGNQARVSVVLGVVGVGLYWVGGAWFGLVGVAAAFTLVRALTLGAGTVFACRALGMTPWDHVRLTLIRFLAPAAMAIVVVFALRAWRTPHGYPEIVAYAVAGVGLYAVSSWRLALDGPERAGLLQLLGRVRLRRT